MKKLKYLICLMLFAVFAGLGILILTEYIYFGRRIFLLALMVYILICWGMTKLSFTQNHILPRLRGWFLKYRLANRPKHFMVGKNVKIFHPDRVSFGNNCDIGEGAVFAPLCQSGGNQYPSNITVGKNVHFGTQDRIASMNSVVIEDDVLFAAFVHVTDHSHEYRKVGLPVRAQSVYTKGPVVIKKGSWLAFGCHVLSGVTIGEYSVVAANAVVTRDVPPYSVVAGNPARVVSRYNFETQEWEKVTEQA